MRLPNDEIGISDIIQYRECPQRFAWSMARHAPMPERFKLAEGEKATPPQADSYATVYGTAVHDAIEIIENSQCSNQEAIDAVWPIHQHWLEPGDADRMEADLEVYRTRTTTGYRVVGTELELRTPLFVHNGVTIYFRGRIDVLYQALQNEAVFLTRDYKSGRWPKTETEVHNDLQQWSYNFLLHENYPEMGTLVQQYDQLRFGSIPTQKSEHQRRQIKAWLVRQVKAILEDEIFKPTSNEWCYSCPLMMDCRVTHMSPDFWINRLAALAPEKKEGRKIVVQLTEDHAGFDIYTDILPKVKRARKVMERFEEAVESVLKEMPASEREELGYSLTKPPTMDTFPASALRRVHELMGDDFFQVASISKTAINGFYGEDTPEASAVIELAEPKQMAPRLKAPRK